MAFEDHGPVEPRVALAQARVLVAGLGVTGRAVAAVLRGAAGTGRVASVVTVAPSDDADVRTPSDPADLAALLADVDLVVTSPGFRPTDPLLVAARDAGVPVWSEVELAWRLRVDRAGGRRPSGSP